MSNETIKGKKAEQLAKAFLIDQKLKFIRSNYLCRWGEIDLIFQDSLQMIVIEVKMRQKRQWLNLYQPIGANKQKKLITTTEHFLQKHSNYQYLMIRFDVIYVCNNQVERWLQDAFRAE